MKLVLNLSKDSWQNELAFTSVRMKMVDALIAAAEQGDPDEVRRLLKVLMPEYQTADGGEEGSRREALAALGDIRVAFIYGSTAKGTELASSDVDLMVIGDKGPFSLPRNSLPGLPPSFERPLA